MSAQNNFLIEQLSFERVQDAFESNEKKLEKLFMAKGLSWPPKNIFIRSFKAELDLEVWVKQGETYTLFSTYDVCKGSGKLGPKLKQGDKQVPEGFYFIDRFNPESNFWLSLGINYPNEADLIRSDADDAGGDIFIHGSCATVGCLPMTDEIIKDIYIISVLAKNSGQQQIPVYIYPYRFNLLNDMIYKTFNSYSEFWNNLKEDFEYFQTHRKLRAFDINDDGIYIFKN